VRAAVRAAERFLLLDNGHLVFDGGREKLIKLEVPEVLIAVKEWRDCLQDS
jgi:ABC-type uncharacterized transport system ATPase component